MIRTAPDATSSGTTRHEEATRKLEEARLARRTAEQALTKLRNRIAATEKSLEEALLLSLRPLACPEAPVSIRRVDQVAVE